MVSPWRRAVVAALIGGLVSGLTYGESGWASSPVVQLPKTRYSVLGPQPECEGQVLVDGSIRRVVEGFGIRTPDPIADEPNWASRLIGNAANLFGLDAVLQDYANCADVCALVPLAATRVTNLLAYVADGEDGAYYQVPLGRRYHYLFWEPDVDTTQVTEAGRLVCVRVRNGATFERSVFLTVGYEVGE